MPSLSGFIDPYSGRTSFLIPAFVDYPGGNRLLVQKISPADTVVDFIEFDAEATYEYSGDPIEMTVGQKALWAFRFQHTSALIHGSSEEITKQLSATLTNGGFDNIPMTKNEVARFCGDFSAFQASLTAPFQLLREQSHLSAEIWRYVVVLLPVIKREIGSALPSSISPNVLNELRVTGAHGRLVIELPAPILKAFPENSWMRELSDTRKLARMFDLGEISFSPQPDLTQAERLPAPKVLPYGVVQGFSGIGDRVVGRSPSSARRLGYVFSPEGSPLDRGELSKSIPLFAFAIIGANASQAADAKRFAAKWGPETIKVMIVMLPTSFGTPRKDRLDAFQLSEFHETFDYIFVVGNHTLRKPLGVAPNLNASNRGVAFAQACIRGFMQFASNYRDTANGIRRRIPRGGIGLVGRYSFQFPRKTSEALQDALDSMLSENLPLTDAETLIIMGTGSAFDSHRDLFNIGRVRELLPRSTRGIRDVLSFQTARRRSWHEVICLAFGIEPRQPDARRFLAFCRDLVALCGWTVSDWPKHELFFVASRGANRALVCCLLRLRDIQNVIDSLSSRSIRSRQSTAIVLTNFTPSRAIKGLFESNGIRIVHYSHFELVANGFNR